MDTCYDAHIIILIIIMISVGAFGGYLNYLHSFDRNDNGENNKLTRCKYILLGIGASLLVPVFLKMIASDLIKKTEQYDNICYLVFAGFCMIAAIFSRRFIKSIGERILEKAEKAEESAQKAQKSVHENKEQIESTKKELISTQERIEDVKVSVSLNQDRLENVDTDKGEERKVLIDLVDTYLQKTYISDYTERLKKKAEIGRRMGQIIVSNGFSKIDLLNEYPNSEGMYLAIAYSIELKPEFADIAILNRLSNMATQLYTQYVILIAYRTCAASGLIKKEQVKEIVNIIKKFREKADPPLHRNIEDAINVLRFIDPSIQ